MHHFVCLIHKISRIYTKVVAVTWQVEMFKSTSQRYWTNTKLCCLPGLWLCWKRRRRRRKRKQPPSSPSLTLFSCHTPTGTVTLISSSCQTRCWWAWPWTWSRCSAGGRLGTSGAPSPAGWAGWRGQRYPGSSQPPTPPGSGSGFPAPGCGLRPLAPAGRGTGPACSPPGTRERPSHWNGNEC